MNKSMLAAMLVVFAGALCATEPAKKVSAAPAAAQGAAAQPAPQPKKTDKYADQDAEESVVMIDSKADAEDGAVYTGNSGERDDSLVPGGIPSSYGQCKGILNEGGRNILVFESIEDGSLAFVQLTLGKAKISWKLLDRLPRSAD